MLAAEGKLVTRYVTLQETMAQENSRRFGKKYRPLGARPGEKEQFFTVFNLVAVDRLELSTPRI